MPHEKIIIAISVDFPCGKQVANLMKHSTFNHISQIPERMKELALGLGVDMDEVEILNSADEHFFCYPLNSFIKALNDQEINVESFWFAVIYSNEERKAV